MKMGNLICCVSKKTFNDYKISVAIRFEQQQRMFQDELNKIKQNIFDINK